MGGGKVAHPQMPCTSLAAQEVEMVKMRQAVDTVCHNLRAISAMESGVGGQGGTSGGKTSERREGTEEIQDTR